MKMNKYISLAALAVAFTSCQEDTLVQDPQQGKIYTLSAKMDGGAAMSRAQIQLGNTDASVGEIFFWNEGDSFTLYQGDNDSYTEHVFTIKDYSEEGEGDKKTASFVTDNPISPGEVIGVYPSGMPMDYDQEIMKVGMDFQTELDFGQGTVEEVWKDYFRNNLVMKTKATLTEGGNNTLQFEHLTSLARITYHNQSGQDQHVTEIVLGGDQFFGFSKTVWFKYDIIGGNSSNGYRINYKNLTVKDGESFDFYILFGPNDFREGDMHIHIHTAQTDVNREPLKLPTATIAAANNNATKFEAGKRYWFKVTETSSELVWSKDFSSDVVTIKNAELSQALYGVLGASNVKLDDNGYAVMTKEFVESVTTLDFGYRKYTITSLSGIESFNNLQSLRCNNTGLVECDLSKNKALRTVNLGYQKFSKFILNEMENLESIDLAFSQWNLTDVNLNNNVNLGRISLASCGKLANLNVEGCNNIFNLDLRNTQISTLTIPNPSRVTWLGCAETLQIDWDKFTNLRTLWMWGMTDSYLESIPNTIKQNLTDFHCGQGTLTNLNLNDFPKLISLACFDNLLTSLDTSKNLNLTSLDCSGNRLTTLDLTTNTLLEELFCGNQTDENGNKVTLKLKLSDKVLGLWNNEWSTAPSNSNVELVTGSSVETGSGNTGGSDFTIEGIY